MQMVYSLPSTAEKNITNNDLKYESPIRIGYNLYWHFLLEIIFLNLKIINKNISHLFLGRFVCCHLPLPCAQDAWQIAIQREPQILAEVPLPRDSLWWPRCTHRHVRRRLWRDTTWDSSLPSSNSTWNQLKQNSSENIWKYFDLI